ncbi:MULTISPECIES: TetR/AcrR family transcriptional regulator [unclassified Paenibacillus]|uniref:TetR/AcrR family transcriptional regulator n=1 Tax=unclassified Paenibacillus TaxID=185978 RepID=UPI001AE6EF70|nr:MULTISPECIES: TetR/AcrR family transcriptional regulator [unclassified Paenibacillus]MBP1156831.1 AcrR family transcriptional regulator [Paenibacillus sp. PvP091]MBP1172430.1 AcrR family transcriptional regulator [Paenibacillus sp. PvR098]MBP2438811.1 AcrR family transcriptional regulator [Paenibacillus sp. PvP052]
MGQRGRKVGANGEQSRALLLAIAADEFAHQGYYQTKVSTIVARAGLTQPTFYLYFQSKEAIFQELIDLFRSKLADLTIKSRLEQGIDLNDLPQRIAAGLTAIFRFFDEEPNLTRIGFFVALEAEEIKKQLAAQIRENLKAEQQDGYFHADLDMSTVAESLVGTIERLTLTKLLQGSMDPECIAGEIVRLFLYGLIANKDGQ